MGTLVEWSKRDINIEFWTQLERLIQATYPLPSTSASNRYSSICVIYVHIIVTQTYASSATQSKIPDFEVFQIPFRLIFSQTIVHLFFCFVLYFNPLLYSDRYSHIGNPFLSCLYYCSAGDVNNKTAITYFQIDFHQVIHLCQLH